MESEPTVRLSFTCNRNWEDMIPVTDGRFCNDCQKLVVDFTSKSNDEIAAYLMSSTMKVCGRFQQYQLAPALPKPLWKRWISAVAMFVAVFIGIKEASAQTIVPQDTVSKTDKSVVSFGVPEKLPAFPAGEAAFNDYLHHNIQKPKDVHGRLIASFTVEKDGSLTEIRILRGLTKETDEEVLRVLKASPKWKPSIQNGIIIRAAYTMPISF